MARTKEYADIRGDGALSTADLDYLAGQRDLAEQSERQTRQRIRDRMRATLFDFSAVRGDLDPYDQELIFSPKYDPGDLPTDQAIIDALAVFYMGIVNRHKGDDGIQAGHEIFETLLRDAIVSGLEGHGHDGYAVEVDIDIEQVPPREEIDDLGEQSPRVLRVLLDRGEITKDEFVDAVA